MVIGRKTLNTFRQDLSVVNFDTVLYENGKLDIISTIQELVPWASRQSNQANLQIKRDISLREGKGWRSALIIA